MTLPLVSVIVPCYNQAQYLPETLDSVFAQSYSNWECIIVNDGSPDNTEEIAKLYCKKDSRFKYIYKENGGLSSARNVGIKSSFGEFILPLDSDDLIGEHYLEKGIAHYQEFPETKIVYCRVQRFGDETGEWNLPDYKYSTLLFENIIFCSAIYKRCDYDATLGYNENFTSGFEDWDFWLTLIKESDVIYKIPEIHFYYRSRGNSMLKNVTLEIGHELRREIYNNHKDKYEQYISDFIWIYNQQTQQKLIIETLEQKLRTIQNAKAYKLGKFLLRPLSFLKKFLP